MKKRILSLLMCLCLTLSLLPGAALAAGQYDDIDGHWAQSAIERWSEYKIVQGSDGHFNPDASLTRAEMAVILANTLGLTDEGSGNPFSDVAADAWYAPYVLRCSAAGIMKGDGTNANPTATISRQEAMVMLCRALSIAEKPNADLSAYGDGSSVASWATGSLAAMIDAGIVSGVSGNLLAPTAEINRASTVTILDRAIVQYINTPGSHTLTDKDGIILVAVSGDVTLTGETSADILVTPAAKGKTLAFDKATVTGAITVQADNMKIIKSESTLPEIFAVGDNITTEDKPTESAKPSRPSGGGSGGGSSSGGGGSSTPSVTLTANATGEGGKLAVGDKLTAAVSNGSGYELVWNVGGFDQESSSTEYTVTAADLGKVIFVKLVKDGEDDIKSSQFTVAGSAPLDTSEAGKDTAPVVLGDSVTFKDAGGNDITVDTSSEDTQLVLSVAEKTVTEEEAVATKAEVKEDVEASVAEAIKGDSGTDVTLTDAQKADLAAATQVKAVDVDLTMVTTTKDEATGETTTEETAVHPVGETTVRLSAAQLGMAGEDLNLYHFVASHTNQAGESQTVAGTVDAKGETVTFVTNGLSTIWVGNVPPRTVNFDTDGGTAVASQKVKFGNRVNTSKLPEKIEKSGYLFCGWNYDLAVTPVIADMTITAVWVAGSYVPANRITAALSSEDSSITLTREAGKVTAAADKDAESFAADLTVSLSVANLDGAVKYGVSAAAQTAAAMEAKDMTDVSGDSVTLTPATVTDNSGKVIAGKTSYYIKWLDKDGKVLALEELLVVVDDGQGAAESKTVTRNVNRGLGRFEPYMTSSSKADAPIWVGFINGNLEQHYAETRSESYDLYFNVGFEEWHFNGSYNQETGKWEYQYESKDYDTLTVEFTPFTGEDFASKDISASFEYYDGSKWSYDLSCTVTRKDDGKLTVTLDTGTLSAPATQRWLNNLNLYLTVDGVESRINFYDVPNTNYTGNVNRESETVNFTDMASLKTALDGVTTDKYWNITYSGDAAEFTIDESIDIPVNCEVRFGTNNDSPVSVTVASGVTVTMHSGEDDASRINCYSGSITLKGTIIADFSAPDEFTNRRFIDVYCDQITVAPGGSIEVGEDTPFMLSGRTYNGNYTSICTLEAGSTVTVAESGNLNIQGFGTATLAGQVDVSNGRLYLHNDSNVVSGTVSVNSTYWRGAEFYGTTTIESTGKVSAAGASRGYVVEFNGPLDNKGSITVAGGAKVIVSNMGYASQSSGSIEVNGTLDLSGTKLVNTGTITGSGAITGALGEDTTSYDEQNGLAYVEVSGSQTPDNYSRYKFTKDPAKTVEVTLYKASLSNEQGGTCSITPDFEEFPEN